MALTALEQQAAQIQAKRQELAEIFTKSKQPDGRFDFEKAGSSREDVVARNTELADLQKTYDQARDDHRIEMANKEGLEQLNRVDDPTMRHGRGRTDGTGTSRNGEVIDLAESTPGRLLTKSDSYKSFLKRREESGTIAPFTLDIPFEPLVTKAMAETGTGYAPPNYRTNIVVYSPQRRPVVADLIPQDPTNLQAVKYMEETTYTNNAAMTAEGGAAPTNTLGYTERTVLVEWLPVILPITEQQLEDVPQIEGIVNNRLTLMLRQSEELQLLNGTGTSPQLQGFYTKTGILTQNKGTDSTVACIFKLITQIRSVQGFAEPSGIVIHPVDWQDIRLLQTSTGAFLFGNPDQPGPDRLWGLTVAPTIAATQSKPLLGDFLMFSHISRRSGLRIEVGYINDDFQRGQRTIRAAERLSLEIYRAAAFGYCDFTA